MKHLYSEDSPLLCCSNYGGDFEDQIFVCCPCGCFAPTFSHEAHISLRAGDGYTCYICG